MAALLGPAAAANGARLEQRLCHEVLHSLPLPVAVMLQQILKFCHDSLGRHRRWEPLHSCRVTITRQQVSREAHYPPFGLWHGHIGVCR